MGKNDFDRDFDFEKEYGFDPKAFLGAEEYDDNIDLSEFSDEELGLNPRTEPQPEAAPEDGDLGLDDLDLGDMDADGDFDPDMDLDEFLNLGSRKEPEEEEEDFPEDDFADEDFPEEDGFADEDFPEKDEFVDEDLPEEEDLAAGLRFPKISDFPEPEDPQTVAMEMDMDMHTDYSEQAEDTPVFEDGPVDQGAGNGGSAKSKKPSAPRPRKERKPVKPAGPNIFTKFYDLYFAPVLNKSYQEEPQDPNNPRRRRRKSKAQIFKEVYLPPIIACVCLILVLSFVIGSISNLIEEKKINKQNEQSRLDESQSALDLAQIEQQRILSEAAKLAACYDYDAAIEMLESYGDLTAYPELATKRSEYSTAKDQLIELQDPSMIPNLSFHVLMADPARAFKPDDLSGLYNRNFVSTTEFTKILNDLYNNGYVLVDFNSFTERSGDVILSKSIYLPEGKKPFMLTETLVNYFEYMIDSNGDGLADAGGDGFASKLVLDSNGDIKAEYVDSSGATLIGDYDLVPILESFIAEHPDFSYRGARATLAVTGSQGVFGYRINSEYIATKGQTYHDEQVAGAKQIVQALQDKGYTIACFTYANKKYGEMNANQIQEDLQKWTQQITPVIGEVDTFVFAQTSDITDYTGNAFNVMYTSGFRYFVSNASTPSTEVKSNYVRQKRLMVTGNSMAYNSSWFTGMFDCAAILDVNLRGNVPN